MLQYKQCDWVASIENDRFNMTFGLIIDIKIRNTLFLAIEAAVKKKKQSKYTVS